jgi:dihydrodipicolinate synthase/N-acetylneuraminate lyase
MKYTPIHGVIVPMLTPFTADDQMDHAGVTALIDFLIARGVSGLFPLGTTGEGPLLTNTERMQMAEWVIQHTGGRVPVIIHSGTITTRETIDLSRHAYESGADAVAIVPPYFFKLSDQALYAHFAAVARAVPALPIYLYNNPGVTPNVLTTELVIQLAGDFENIVGLKDSSGSLATLFAARGLKDGRFNSASGPDGLIMAGQAIGLNACVAGNANFVPELIVGIFAAVHDGDLIRARALQEQLDAVRRLAGDGSSLSMFKGLCARRGVPIGDVRAPLRRESAGAVDVCWQAVQALSVLPVSS